MLAPRVFGSSVGFIGLALALAGCGASAIEPGSPGEAPAAAPVTPDSEMAQVAAKTPEFGGMFLGADGKLNVFVTDLAASGLAQQAIADVYGAEVLAGGVRVREGQFGFGELAAWNDTLFGVFDLDGVVSTDIDEARNRLRVGVASPSAMAGVEREIARLGIPRGAVLIEVVDPIVPLVTLQQLVRPLQGGIQINFPGYLCTYGFNATRAGVSGFVTNSHCTSTQGGVESTPYWQPLQSVDPVQIATEIADPTYRRENCPSSIKGKKCRWSDSSFAQLASGASASLGTIARTTGLGSLAIDTANPTFTISAEESAAVVGQTVNKVGRTTGWSQGAISLTCVNTGVLGSSILQRCQNHVSAAVGSGDSGSPAFRIDGETGSALLKGILWGGNQAGTSFVYSPIGNIETDLGALTTQ